MPWDTRSPTSTGSELWLDGSWTASEAGGVPPSNAWHSNPQAAICPVVSSSFELELNLKDAPQAVALWVMEADYIGQRKARWAGFVDKAEGAAGTCRLPIMLSPNRPYVVFCATAEPHKYARFRLSLRGANSESARFEPLTETSGAASGAAGPYSSHSSSSVNVVPPAGSQVGRGEGTAATSAAAAATVIGIAAATASDSTAARVLVASPSGLSRACRGPRRAQRRRSRCQRRRARQLGCERGQVSARAAARRLEDGVRS